jgi:hypothetical protein
MKLTINLKKFSSNNARCEEIAVVNELSTEEFKEWTEAVVALMGPLIDALAQAENIEIQTEDKE